MSNVSEWWGSFSICWGLLVLFLMSFFIVNSSYMFSVLFLGVVVFLNMGILVSGVMYLKFLVMVIYISGIVVFVMYMSCLCWAKKIVKGSFILLLFLCLMYSVIDYGLKLVGLWGGGELSMYLFFGLVFSSLVMVFSLILFSSSGSLRF